MNSKELNHNVSKKRINIIVLIFSILVIAVIAFCGVYLSRKYVVNQAELRMNDVMLEAEALHHYVQREMHPTMYLLKDEGRMPKEFFSPEILSSSFITRRVFRQYNLVRKQNDLPLVEYSMASKNPRNKINQADSLEARILDLFNSNSTIKKYTGIIDENGEKYLYYAKPFLRIEGKCLKCHGRKESAPIELSTYYNWDSGFDWIIGDVPAIEIIKTPLLTEFKALSRIWIVIFIVAVILIILIILYSRLSIKNGIINFQKNEIEENLNILKETQSQLVQSEKMASLGVLTAGVAHEINNPLNFINGAYLGMELFFNSKAPERKEEVAILLKGLQTGIERASEIVQGLNHLSRDSKSYDEECNVHLIIDNCLIMLKNTYRDRIQVVKQYELDEFIIKGNEGKLHQVFINILSNAIQSIKNEGYISVKTQCINKELIIWITDTGSGIKQENISKVLDPFFTTKDPGKGTGIGLSISYKILKGHNGDIELESEIHKGTTVKIKLPTT